MSQTSYTKKPIWNNDGLMPNDVSTNVYAAFDGWDAPLAGTKKKNITSMTWAGSVVTVQTSANAVTLTGTIANDILTATAVTGTLAPGQQLFCAAGGMVDGVFISQQGQAIATGCSTSAANPAILTVGPMASKFPFVVGMTVTGTGVGAGVTIASGTYPTFTLSGPVTTPGTNLTITGSTAAGGAGVYALTHSNTALTGASLTSVTPHLLKTGYDVIIYGVTPAGYNGVFKNVTVTGPNTFTYPLTSNPGAVTVQGKMGHPETVVALRGLDAVAADLAVIPTFTAATAYTAAGYPHFVTGDTMKITLTVSEPIQLNFTAATKPYINITINGTVRKAYYDGADSTSTSLDFDYVVVAGDVSTAGQVTIGNAINLGGGQIIDIAGVGGTQNAPFTPGTFTAPVVTTWYTN